MGTNKYNLWGIILAGGAGKRLLEFTRELYGYPRPKQYCVIAGARSMLEHTLDRARLLISPDRLLTVIIQPHVKYVEEIHRDQPSKAFVIQPECRDTGPGLLLPLMKIHHMDPGSITVSLPADHFVLENRRFMKYVEGAADFVEAHPEFLVMLGVKPHRPEAEYGWIEPGKARIPYRGNIYYPVHRFWEKPSPEMAEELHATGCLWNTFVLIGRTSTFLKHIQEHMPEVFTIFESVQDAFGTPREQEVLKTAYIKIPSVNFSRSVLEHVSDHLYVLEASGVYWSDWGNESRIRLDIEQFNLSRSNGSRTKMFRAGD